MSFLSNVNPIRIAQAVISPGGAVAGAIADNVFAPSAPAAPAAPPEIKLPPGALPPARPGNASYDADVAAAKAEAQALWHPAGGPATAYGGRQIQEQGGSIDVPDEKRDAAAVMEVFKNRELEKQALAKLPKEQQAQYAACANMFEHDPQAHLAMQMLLLEGKLGGKTVDGKQDLLGALDQMRKTEMQPPITSGQLMAETVREIADPSRIKQKDAETCAVASLQVQLATEKPAEYARIVAGLGAKGDGSVKLTGEKTVKRAGDLSEKDAFGHRTASSRLFQGAMMTYGAEHSTELSGYDAKTDQVTRRKNGEKGRGLDASGAQAVREAVLGARLNTTDLNQASHDIYSKLQVNDEVVIGTEYGPDGKLKNSDLFTVVQHNGDHVILDGPDGQIKLPMSAFQARVEEVNRKNGPLTTKEFRRMDHQTAMMAELKDDLDPKNKQSVPVSIRWGAFDPKSGNVIGDKGQGNQRHIVTVTEIKDGRVYYLNSQGSKESMTEEDFRNRLETTLTQGPRVSK